MSNTRIGLHEIVINGYVFDVVLIENWFYCCGNNIFDNEINNEWMSTGFVFQKSEGSDFRIRNCDNIGYFDLSERE